MFFWLKRLLGHQDTGTTQVSRTANTSHTERTHRHQEAGATQDGKTVKTSSAEKPHEFQKAGTNQANKSGKTNRTKKTHRQQNAGTIHKSKTPESSSTSTKENLETTPAEIARILTHLRLGMTQNDLVNLLGPPSVAVGPFITWRRPEGIYQLVLENGALAQMYAVPPCVSKVRRLRHDTASTPTQEIAIYFCYAEMPPARKRFEGIKQLINQRRNKLSLHGVLELRTDTISAEIPCPNWVVIHVTNALSSHGVLDQFMQDLNMQSGDLDFDDHDQQKGDGIMRNKRRSKLHDNLTF